MDQVPPLHPDDKQTPAPSAQLLSEREIRKQLWVDGVQDRAILLPLGVSAIALVYSLLYAPFLGGLSWSLIIATASGLTGAAVFLWRFAIQYPQQFARKSQELAACYAAENSRRAEAWLTESCSNLEQGFQEIGSLEGLNALHKLASEYKQLQPITAHGHEADLLSMSNLPGLVRETYLQGLNVLKNCLELDRAVRSTNIILLKEEIETLEKKLAAAGKQAFSPSYLAMIQEKLDSSKERLTMVERLQSRVYELLHQAERCEASLGKARIELAALKVDASDIAVQAVTDTLRETITRAREVQAELKRMGYLPD